jgi:hypothetical protein
LHQSWSGTFVRTTQNATRLRVVFGRESSFFGANSAIPVQDGIVDIPCAAIVQRHGDPQVRLPEWCGANLTHG